ncbi:carboxylesterase/lipase family protein [Sphingosinicella sp. BN140058]|uniref:carboxylesterase/lipase family protein n=1 Tax=Sphingosinicella sp. BN140058 TaxID=1892855 RepID=UPI0013EC005D|nr:carboxylesterase family protein [Sphingosinicella sp. BN140058]
MTMIARAIAAAMASLLLAAAPPPTVKVEGGVVRGAQDGGASIFRGIPFAAPPIGARRWTAPAPVEPWRGVRDAAAPAAACIQNDQGWNHADFVSADEDCLPLDIRTPSLTGRRPVFVWIHGGSNRAGSPGDMVLSRFGKGEIVLVAIRYRLGIFGFLSHRALSAEAGSASGNYGIMDQIAALDWVKRNIARFGGDPDRVTIGGESAGAQDVGLLLAAPAARPLFAQAIMESGTPGFGLPWRSREAGERIGDQADALLQTGGDVARLRAASVPALLQADLRLHDEALEADDYLWLRTTVDGRVFTRTPDVHLKEGPGKPLLIGSNRFELGLPGGRPHRDAFVARAFGDKEAKARAFYRLDQPDPTPDPRMGSRDDQIATDVTFRCPAGTMASLMAAKGRPVWRYEFDLAPGGGRTSHSAELAYIFGEQRLSQTLSLGDYWTRFVLNGDPNGEGLPAWPRYDVADRAHVTFDASGVVPGQRLREDVCRLSDRL